MVKAQFFSRPCSVLQPFHGSIVDTCDPELRGASRCVCWLHFPALAVSACHSAAKWHAHLCNLEAAETRGSLVRQSSRSGSATGPTGQRGCSRHPGGGRRGSGGSPFRSSSLSGRCPGDAPMVGTEASSALVYGWQGL